MSSEVSWRFSTISQISENLFIYGCGSVSLTFFMSGLDFLSALLCGFCIDFWSSLYKKEFVDQDLLVIWLIMVLRLMLCTLLTVLNGVVYFIKYAGTQFSLMSAHAASQPTASSLIERLQKQPLNQLPFWIRHLSPAKINVTLASSDVRDVLGQVLYGGEKVWL